MTVSQTETVTKASTGKRILMLLENNPYPNDDRVRREATTLAQAGYQVAVISPKHPDQPWYEQLGEVRVYRYSAPAPGDGLWGYLWEYGYSMAAAFLLSFVVFARDGFDIVHAHNPPDTFVFIAAFYKLLGKRFVFDHHDLAPEMYYARFRGQGNRIVHSLLIILEKLSCRLADHVIATNQSYRQIHLERGRVQAERITIVRNGPDLERLQPTAPDLALKRRAKTLIGFAGDMGVHDGIDYLLRALRHLVYDLGRTDFLCILIGTGGTWSQMRMLATELGLDEYVWFTGWVSDAELNRYLSTIDIGVDPDPSNPFNDRCTMIKMTEYMVFGKPIVAFDLPEHRVTAQEAAIYAHPNDELDFAQKLALLMDNPEEGQKRGEAGRKRVETELAWPLQKKYLLQAYETIK